MAVTKKPLIRYKILDECFRNPFRSFDIETLLQEVNEKLIEFTDDNEGIKIRQLRDDISFMRSDKGWSVELAELFDGKKRIYRYDDLNFSIRKAPLNDIELNQVQTAIQVLSQFEGMPQFEGIQEIIAKLKTDVKITKSEKPFIGFDRIQDLKGIEFFSELYNSVQNKKVLEIKYQDFYSESPYIFIFHPYYLKEYNNRWFIFGLHPESGKADRNVAIDRIIGIQQLNLSFIENNIDWQDYFSDMIGVSKPENAALEKVVLHFNKLTGRYMENKSIHETQKNKWLNDDVLEVEIKVLINYELERLILSYCDSVTIFEPKHLKDKIISRLENNIKNY
jgi:predicted DNA-binding transcriptional regulator YafY